MSLTSSRDALPMPEALWWARTHGCRDSRDDSLDGSGVVLGNVGKDEMMGLFWKRHKVICLIAALYDITYTLLFPSLRDILGHPWTSWHIHARTAAAPSPSMSSGATSWNHLRAFIFSIDWVAWVGWGVHQDESKNDTLIFHLKIGCF